jgi:cytoskeletal protein CcmA (bactofilin family)
MSMSRGQTSDRHTTEPATALQEKLDRLPLDDELGRIVREGLGRMSPSDLSRITSELDQALNGLRPALDRLYGASDSDVVRISRLVLVEGEVEASEDLFVEGRIEGSVRVEGHALIIGPHGSIKGPVTADTIVVHGLIEGRASATAKVDIRDGGCVIGDIGAPRVAIAEGATFKGSVDMGRSWSYGQRDLNVEDLFLKSSQLPLESPTRVR